MSININSYSSTSSRKGISGLMSGLDTDSLVEQLTSSTRSKITKQLQNKQILSWKQTAYQSITSKMTSFYNDYFRYSSSSNSVMNEKFFNTSTITSSSSNVSVTGNSDSIENVVIKDIQQLAGKTGFTSNHTVSKQSLTSGIINESWKDNTIAGESINISYGGKYQTLTISSNFHLDSTASDSENIQKVVDELNSQINKNSQLKGNLEFSLDATGAIKLSEIGATKTSDLKITGGSNDLMTSLGLYKTESGSSEVTGSYKVEANSFFEENRFANSSIKLNVNINEASTDAYLYLEKDFRFSSGALEKDASGNFTAAAKSLQKDELQAAYNKAIEKNPALKDKISISIDDNLGMTISALGEGSTVKVTGGNEKFLAGLGLSVAEDGAQATSSVSGTVDVAKVFSAEVKQLNEVLSGTTLTFNLNGISKKIEFKESEKDQFSTVEGLKNYLQNSLDKNYGAGKISVSATNGQLDFTTSDPTHVLTLESSSASGIIGENGALHMISGESNRAELVKTLDQMKDSFATPLKADSDGKYRLNVNGKEFEFSGDTALGDVISKINRDADAGVTISYSSVTDKFTVMADETGSQGRVDIEDVGGGNLASALFGTKDSAADGYTVNQGKDFSAVVSFDGGSTFTTINRSSNSFEMDGVTYEVKGMAEGTVEENITFSKTNNVDSMIDKVKDFVEKYNEIVNLIQTKVTEKRYGVDYGSSEKYPPLTDEQKENMSDKEIENWETKAQLGLLANDSTLNSILTNMRKAMTDAVGENGGLYQMGITTGDWKTGGLLTIDEDKLKQALTEDPDKLAQMFTSEDGIASRLNTVLRDAVIGNEKYEGSLVALAGKPQSSGQATNTLATKINSINDTVTSLKTRLKSEETRWYNKFTSLETMIAKFNSQSEYFSSLSS